MRAALPAFCLLILALAGCAEDPAGANEANAPTPAADDAPLNGTSKPVVAEKIANSTDPPVERSWTLPRMRVGDVATYEFPTDEGVEEIQYEVLSAELFYDRQGQGRGVFNVVERSPANIESSDPSTVGLQLVQWRFEPSQFAFVTSGTGDIISYGPSSNSEHWQDTIHDSQTRANQMPLCGFFNSLQGNEVTNSSEMFLLGPLDCVSTGPWIAAESYPFTWTESGEVAGRPVDWFHDVTRRDVHLGVAFDWTIPYPVAVSYDGETATLIDFVRGEGLQVPPPSSGAIELPDNVEVERGPAGPDDSAANIPFTLTEAWTAAMESASFTTVQNFMANNPEAKAFQADAQGMRQRGGLPLADSEAVRNIWSITLVSDTETLHFCVERGAKDSTPIIGDLASNYRFGEGASECGYGQTGQIPAAAGLPDLMPDVVPLLDLWQHYNRLAWEGGGPDHWGFTYSCYEVNCMDPWFSVWVGNSWSWEDDGRHWAVDQLYLQDGAPSSISGLAQVS